MKTTLKFFTFIFILILVNITQAQEANDAQEANVAATHPPFVPPVREGVETNQLPRVNLLKAVQDAFPDIWKVDTNNIPASISSQDEKEKREKAEMARRLIALNEKVQAERRVVTNSVAVANRPAMVTNQVLVTNLAAKVVQPKKADKNAAPPTFVATDSVTDYVASPKDNRAFTYEQEVRVPQTEAEAVNRDHAIARLEGLEQGIWSYRGPAQSAPNTEYRVDQRPLDQGTQPAPAVAYYPAYQQDSYGTYPATPYTTASYAAPTYASYGVIYPVQYYPSYSYGYGSHYSTGYVYPGTRFGVGVSISAGVRSSYGYAPGWSVRRGGVTHYPTYQRNYPTHHSGGDGHHRGGRR